jgi:N-acetylglutamate synthase-like GNAT family acetyltransferase
MNFKIRKAKLQDVNAIYNLGKKTVELDFSKTMHFHDKPEFRDFIRREKTNIFLVAEKDKKIVGFLFAHLIHTCAGGWAMLDNVAVHFSHRGQGIGTALLHTFYNELKKRKIHYVQILEEVHHKRTRKFWKSKGFKEQRHFIWADKIIK